MKILIHGIIVSLLFFGGGTQKSDELIMENMQVFADSLNYDGDMFEISIPKSYSIKKGKEMLLKCFGFLMIQLKLMM